MVRVAPFFDSRCKFELGPHRVWKYGRHPICDRWD